MPNRLLRLVPLLPVLLPAGPLGLVAHAVERTWEYSVQLSAAVSAAPAGITLSWPPDSLGPPSGYTVSRKAPEDPAWGAGQALPGGATSHLDADVQAGVVYEYRVVKTAAAYTGYGYIRTGIAVPLVEDRGTVVLVVEQTAAAGLAAELTRLRADLVGDGWTVRRHDVARTAAVTAVKALIQAEYQADPARVKAVFLLGRVPVPYAGVFNPDGHPDHRGAWPADVYYGDMDGIWTDSSAHHVQSLNTDPADAARLSNRPGDGKFDQDVIPSRVELQVGRVDLSHLPGRVTWGGPATFPGELELLRNYLEKDHRFRHRQVNPARRAIVGDYFGVRGGEAFAASGHRSFAPLVGVDQIRNLNLEYSDRKGVWIPEAAAQDYLLAYACGAGSYTSMGGIGRTGLYHEGDTPELVGRDTRGVFNLLFGSWFGDWDHEDSLLRAPLATSCGLVSVWSGRPHWFLHGLGLGETIGHAAQLTQNNDTLYQNQINSGARQTHIALMGDPTLRLHPVAPPVALAGSFLDGRVTLTWTAAEDRQVLGYHVYRAPGAEGRFVRLTGPLITATEFVDLAPAGGATYLVRAVKLEQTPSGTYLNPSQGVYWTNGDAERPAPVSGATTPPAGAAATTGPVTEPGGGPASRLANFSVLSTVGADEATLMVGFTVSGPGTKRMLVRAVGPTLAAFRVADATADPALRLFDQRTGMIAWNDDWAGASESAAAAAAVAAFPLPADSRDAVLVASLPAGSYTAHVGEAGRGGRALVEVYDTGVGAAAPRLNSLSARGAVGAGSGALTAGFVLTGSIRRTVLIRAVGPGLAAFGVTGVLANPLLRLFSERGEELGRNDNWLPAVGWELASAGVGAFPLPAGSADAVLLVSLPPGLYTAQASGVDRGSGVVLIEIFDVPQPPAAALVLQGGISAVVPE